MAVQASPLRPLFPPSTPVHSHTGFPTTVNIKSGSRETGGKIFHASWKTTFSREALSASVRAKSGGEFESPVVFSPFVKRRKCKFARPNFFSC